MEHEILRRGGGWIRGQYGRHSERILFELRTVSHQLNCGARRLQHERTNVASESPVISARIILLCSITLSASARFQKQTKPVPRDRPVAGSTVIRAYRKGPNLRNLEW